MRHQIVGFVYWEADDRHKSLGGVTYAAEPSAVSDFPHARERDQFGGDLTHLKAPKDLTDEFKNKMLHENPVRFYRLSEGDVAAAGKAK
jgi:hypothetical protein